MSSSTTTLRLRLLAAGLLILTASACASRFTGSGNDELTEEERRYEAATHASMDLVREYVDQQGYEIIEFDTYVATPAKGSFYARLADCERWISYRVTDGVVETYYEVTSYRYMQDSGYTGDDVQKVFFTTLENYLARGENRRCDVSTSTTAA